MSPNEIEALERTVAGPDERAFEALHRLYQRLIEQFVSTRVDNRRQAQEITGRIFDHAWAHIGNYRWQDFSFHVWLMRIAKDHLPEPPPDQAERFPWEQGF